MSANDERVRNLITQEAADWFVANRAGLTVNGRDAFAAWLKSSPLHVEEYLVLSVIAGDLRRACEDSHSSLDALLARARLEEGTPVKPLWLRVTAAIRDVSAQRCQTAMLMMAALAVLSFGLLALWNLKPLPPVLAPPAMTAQHFATRHGEQQTRRLADDSVVHLNTDSAVTIRYSKTERLVVLTSGEADFEVAHQTERPFRVFAGSAEVIALGTKFDVRLGQDSTVITVVEGQVAVGLSPMLAGRGMGSGQSQPQRFVRVSADQQINVAEVGWPATPMAVDAQRTTAWLHRQIMFEHEPLERVASEFNRYASKPIEITTPALRGLEISGVFDTDDTQAFVAFLRSLEGVRVEVTATRIRVSQD